MNFKLLESKIMFRVNMMNEVIDLKILNFKKLVRTSIMWQLSLSGAFMFVAESKVEVLETTARWIFFALRQTYISKLTLKSNV